MRAQIVTLGTFNSRSTCEETLSSAAAIGGRKPQAPKRRDSVLDGVPIGAGVGALAGLISDHYDDCEECHDSLYASIGVGAGVGLLIDALRVKSTASPHSGPQTSLLLGVGSRSVRVRVAGMFAGDDRHPQPQAG
jgi:hypothetical protein